MHCPVDGTTLAMSDRIDGKKRKRKSFLSEMFEFGD